MEVIGGYEYNVEKVNRYRYVMLAATSLRSPVAYLQSLESRNDHKSVKLFECAHLCVILKSTVVEFEKV